MNDPNAISEDFVPYQLNVILNSNQGLVLFKRNENHSRHKNLRKHNSE